MWSFRWLDRLVLDWISVPSQVIVKSRAKVSGGTTTVLKFSLLQLVHAIVKADMAERTHPITAMKRAIGFLWEWGDAFTSRGTNLRIDTTVYNDFVATSLIGRIGQGLSLLYCYNHGYKYLGSFSAIFGQPCGKGPDFVLEKHGKDRAFLESKATTKSNAKSNLKKALNQLQSGFRVSGPSVIEGYATSVHLRPVDDCEDSKAFVTQVANTTPAVGAPDDTVIRHNYGLWLQFMGHFPLTSSLLTPQRRYQGPQISFRLLEIADRTFAFVPLMALRGAFWPLLYWNRYWESDLWYILRWMEIPILIAGIDLANLRYLARRAQEGAELERQELQVTEIQVHEIRRGVVSIFPDTTALGILLFEDLKDLSRGYANV